MVLRGTPWLVVVAALAVSAAVPVALASTSLRVRPLTRAESVKRPPAGTTPARTPADMERLRIQAERERRWRSFDDDLMRARDRSSFASRRRGARFSSAYRARPHVLPEGPGLGGPPQVLRVAFIRVDFASDRSGAKTSGDGHFDLSNPGDSYPPVDRAPHNRTFYQAHFEALKRFYTAQSYGQILLDGDVFPHDENLAYHMSDMADLVPDPRGWSVSQPDATGRTAEI